MSDRLNQYQRRQLKRRDDRIVGRAMFQAFWLTVLGFGVYYLAIRDALNKAMYQTVLNAGGRITYADVAWSKLTDFLLPFFVTFFVLWITLGVISMLRADRRHNEFQFAEDVVAQPSMGKTRRPINLARISPRQFEEEVARMITARTGYRAQVVGGAGDHGVDIKVYDHSQRLVGVVQCKRYRPNKALPPMFVREMVAVRMSHNVNIAYLATTAYFTAESHREAERLGIRLIDGRDLRLIAQKTGSPAIAQSSALQSGASVADRPQMHTPPPARRPTDEQDLIQQQLDERRQRLAGQPRYNAPAPTVRQAPPAIRTTPGTENQYAPPRNIPAPPPPRPLPEPPPSKEMLRWSRDAQIRRNQNAK